MQSRVTFWILCSLLLSHVAASQGSTSGSHSANAARQGGKDENVQVILQIFAAVEHRDGQAMATLLQPDVEFVWPTPLPYAGVSRLSEAKHPGWGETWIPLQPTEAERKMDPRVIAASNDEVVVLWHQRGKSQTGERFESEVLGLYRFREGKLARAQMFDFDAEGAAQFLARARTQPSQPKP